MQAGLISSPSEEPNVEINIAGINQTFLLDTGAAKSVLTSSLNLPMTRKTIRAVGVSGEVQTYPLTAPAEVTIGPLHTKHSFLLAASAPTNLLGRDLLCKMGCVIYCTPDGVFLDIPTNYAEEVQDLLETPHKLMVISSQVTQFPSQVEEMLSQVPGSLWTKDRQDAGLMANVAPVMVHLKSGRQAPKIPQYPLKPEVELGVLPVIEQLVQQGILTRTSSVANSPIFPVKKAGGRGYRLVQDLRGVNKVVESQFPVVPNPAVILMQIPSTSTHFTVIDLCSAFFSIPLHPDCQYLFAFTFRGVQYTWTRLPQGFVDSPSIFSQALHDCLQSFQPSNGSVLIQYVDDLLLCADSFEASLSDTKELLFHLALTGHKVSREKLQPCEAKVKYLGHCLTKGLRHLTEDRIKAIQSMTLPQNQQQIRSFLGACGYCRNWIPGFAILALPLQELVSASKPDRVNHTQESELAFENLKKSLMSAPALGIPDYTKSFDLYCTEAAGCAAGVLTQKHGDANRPVAYYSAQLDTVARSLPTCLRAVAAAALLVSKSEDVVLGHDLTVHVPHAVSALLNSAQTRHVSSARFTRWELALIAPTNIMLKRCNTLNPASYLPYVPHNAQRVDREDEDESEETAEVGEYMDTHDCAEYLNQTFTARPDICDTPLENADLTFYTDGSCHRQTDTGELCTGYAVVDDDNVVEAEPLGPPHSAQVAELIALRRACELAEGKTANIYTDSRYAFGVVHDFGALWRLRNFMTAAGTPIAHSSHIKGLLSAIQLPSQVAVIKCKAHTYETDMVSKGNQRADEAAKKAAASLRSEKCGINNVMFFETLSMQKLIDMQDLCSPQEKAVWMAKGCKQESSGLWVDGNGKPVAPKAYLPALAEAAHGLTHLGKEGMCRLVRSYWSAPGFSGLAYKKVKSCLICLRKNIGKTIPVEPSHIPPTEGPFQVIQIDFIQLPPCRNLKYVLVCVDVFSHWVEAYPAAACTAAFTAKKLVHEFVCRFGIPRVIESDQGTQFTSDVFKSMCKLMGIKSALHTPYHPQASGKVERFNGVIKNKLSKIMAETGLAWPEALPLVLHSIRTTPRSPLNLSPYEILFGRQPHLMVNPQDDLKCNSEVTVQYLIKMSKQLRLQQKSLKLIAPEMPQTNCHDIEPGDFIMIRNFLRSGCLVDRWEGPYQVLLTSTTSVKVAERDTWVHSSHCKRAVDPRETRDEEEVEQTDPNLECLFQEDV